MIKVIGIFFDEKNMTLIKHLTLCMVKASTFHYLEEKIIVNKTHQLIPGVVTAISRVMVHH
jgi:hypothetical protein